jgi:hypothetical protein
VTTCSPDAFTVRPLSYTVTSSNANADSAAGASATNSPTIKTGVAFTLTAGTSTKGYFGTPVIDATKVQWPSAPAGGRAAPSVGTVGGTFTTAASVGTGNGATGSFTYDEVGYFQFATGGVFDSAYAAISGDVGNGDCTNDASNTLVNGKYGCKVANQAATNYFGRFIPDHFALVSPVLAPGCGAGAYTYMDQPFSLTASIEAQNATNIKTQNYSGASFAKGIVSTQAENSNNGTALGSRVTFTAPWSGGAATYSATKFARPVTTTADATWGPFDALSFGAKVTDADGVVFINRTMDETNGACTADSSGTSDGTCPAVTIASGAKLRFGRLRMQNAYGSELLALAVPIETQYWNGKSFDRNLLDSCTSLAAANVNLINYQGGITATNMGLGHITSVDAFGAGLSWVHLSKPSPAPATMGSMDLIINLGSAGAPVTCPTATPPTPLGASTSAASPYLSGRWCTATAYDRDPSSRATFGSFKSPLIYRRENY